MYVNVALLQEDFTQPGVLWSEPPRKETISSESKEIDLKDEAGISLSFPENSIAKDKPVNVDIRISFCGPFKLPDDVESASPAYLIKFDDDVVFSKDVDVRIQHNVDLSTEDDCNDVVFLKASSTPTYPDPNNSEPVYEFREIEGGMVERKRNFGVLKLRSFSWLKIGRKKKKNNGEEIVVL